MPPRNSGIQTAWKPSLVFGFRQAAQVPACLPHLTYRDVGNAGNCMEQLQPTIPGSRPGRNDDVLAKALINNALIINGIYHFVINCRQTLDYSKVISPDF